MDTLKDIVDIIGESLLTNQYINTVTFGDDKEVDISKQTSFGLAHIMPAPIQYLAGYSLYGLNIYALDTYSSSLEERLNVMSNMASVLEQLSRSLQRGQLFNVLVRVQGVPTAVPVYDQFQNRLYGYMLSVAIQVPDNVDVCVG